MLSHQTNFFYRCYTIKFAVGIIKAFDFWLMLCIPEDFSTIFLQLFFMIYTIDTGINDTKFDPYILNIKAIIVLLQYASLFSTLLHNYSLSFQT